VREIFPKLSIDKINKIEVLPTPFGSVGSFFFDRVGSKFNFKLTIRDDFGPAQIAETILTNLIWIDHPTPNLAVWHQTEAIVDFVLTKSKLAKIFSYSYIPTISAMPEISKNYISESETYLKKLGFPIKPVELDVKFTPTEKRIFEGIVSKKGQIVTYDQIGDWFWGENALDKYSLYSVAKIMEKIRKKIKDQGIYQELIYTVRGQGYVLYD
jgi:DNA-binding winged helix-turn-helix (wHTH) protein